jgi:hypothetical protein
VIAASGTGWGVVLRTRYSLGLVLATLVGRLAQNGTPIVLILAARAEGATFAWGAALAAVYAGAFATGQPLLGRAADRYGQTLPIAGGALIAGVAHACLTLPGAVTSNAGVLMAAVAGLAAPPLEAGLRTLWASLVPGRALHRAYALDAMFQEAGHVLAPLLVVGCVAVGGPMAALGTMALLGVAGATAVAVSPPSRAWRPHRSAGGWLGALRPPGMPQLLLMLVAVGSALGALTLNSARASEAWDAGWIAGALPAAVSAGALAGNAAYGVRAWPMPIRHQLPLAAVAFTAGWLPLLAAHHPLTATGAALLAGLALGPLLLTCFAAIDLLTPPSMRTEAYGLLICAMGGGTALGSYIAGHAGTWPLAIVPLLAAALAAVLATSVRRPLRHARSTPSLIVLRGGKAASDPRDRSPYTSTTPAGEANDHKEER